MRENETEAGKVRWVLWVWLDGSDEDGDGRTKMGTNPDITRLILGRPLLGLHRRLSHGLLHAGAFQRRTLSLESHAAEVDEPPQRGRTLVLP